MTTVKIATWVNDDCTIGRLHVGDLHCYTLELPWRQNGRGISCIPEGKYPAIKYLSPKHGMVVLIQDVPDRDMIEIHAGNYTRQIKGCILPGKSITYLDGDTVPDVTSSRSTLAKLMAALPDAFTVEITRAF